MAQRRAFEQETPRLRLRRPVPDDLEAYTALHTDPRTYAHAPASMPDVDGCVGRLNSDLEHWAEHGFGYLAAEERESGRLVGWGGVRSFDADADRPLEVNLYYRLAYDALGRGLGRELARAVVAAALEDLPDRTVLARVKPHNHASLATAVAAGLVEVGTEPHPDDRPGEPPSVVLEAPHVTAVTELDAALREEVLDVWLAVNDAGGAVGFQPGATREVVASALEGHEAVLSAGRGVLGLLRAPGGELLGLGFWQQSQWWGFGHVATLWRVMVAPAAQGRGTGRLLVAALHGVARRRFPDAELWRLDYRSGLGLGDFYAGLGWVETGRQPRGLRFPDGDRRDDVAMARRPDGGPLEYDGRR